jgi:hypothetical protein
VSTERQGDMDTGLWFHADLTNWLPREGSGCMTCFDGLFILKSDGNAKVAPGSITANVSLSPELAIPDPSPVGPLDILSASCDLLSFASRRAVSFTTDEAWLPQGTSHDARGPDWGRGPVELVDEVQSLLTRVLPILLDPAKEDNTRLRAALRWFLSSRMQHGIEMCYVVLWIVLEMTARAYWAGKDCRQRNDFLTVKRYLDAIALPDLDTKAFERFYGARSDIVHALLGKAGEDMWKSFGHWADERENAQTAYRAMVGRLRSDQFAADGQERRADRYNRALNEACFFLSRVLEKMFLARWGCTDLWFYGNACYFTVWGP